jgi:CHAT domain-containing protein
MAAFYARLAAGTNPAAALRVAQLHVKQQQPHPFFWAAFVAVGRW